MSTTTFGFETTAAEAAAGIDLSGKRAIVTGAASGHRRRDRTGARRRRRRGDPRGARPRRRRADRRRHRRRRPRRPPRPRRSGVGEGVRRRLGRAAARARQQRRRDGDPGAHAHARGLGDAVRHQSPRPLRARARPARRARRRRQRAHRLGQLGRAPALAGRVGRHPLQLPRLRPVARLRPVEDGQRAVRRRGDPPLGRRRHHRQRADAGRHRHRPAAPPRPRVHEPRTQVGRAAAQDDRAGRRDVGPAGGLARSRRRRRPLLRGLPARRRSSIGATATRPRGVARYALDPANAERLWEDSLRMLG